MMQEYNYHSKIMGCDFDMTFIARSVEQADRYFTKANNIANVYEKRFSRFDKNSELYFINKNKSTEASQKFLQVYWIAYNLYKKTNKQFNPLMQVSHIGYDKSFEKMFETTCKNLSAVDYNVNLDDVVILPDRIILQDSQNLDFGGFLKGYVAQYITQNIDSENGVIVNIGGDMYVKGGDINREVIVVEIVHPHDCTKNISVALSDKSLCTSGTYKRRWTTSQGKKHHILNTCTKDSAETDIISASVIHKEGAVADAYATLAITLGSEKARQFFDKEKIEYVMICENSDIIMGLEYFSKKIC